MYRVLRSHPLTEKTSEPVPGSDPKAYFHRVTHWPVLGYANSYEEARETFGGRPVLEWVGEPQVIEGSETWPS